MKKVYPWKTRAYLYLEDAKGRYKFHLKNWKVSSNGKTSAFKELVNDFAELEVRHLNPMKLRGEVDYIKFDSWKWWQFWKRWKK